MKPSLILASLLPPAAVLAAPHHVTASNSAQSTNITSIADSNSFTNLATISTDQTSIGAAGAYPRLAWRSDGTIIGSYTAFSGTTNTLTVVQSDDGGQTFSALGSIASSTGDLDNCFLLEVPLSSYPYLQAFAAAQNSIASAPGSAMLAAYRNHDVDSTTGEYTYYRLTISISYDGGATWVFLVNPVQSPPLTGNTEGFWEPFMRIGSAGEIQLSFSKTEATDNQETFRSASYDGGQSWTAPQCLVCHAADQKQRDGMQSIVDATDAEIGWEALVIVYETTSNGTFSVQYAVSYDDGASWGARMTVYEPADGHNAGSPQIATFADGGLVVVFMTDEDAATAEWPSDATIKAVAAQGLSGGTIAWSKPSLVADAVSNWPGLLNSTDTGITTVYATENTLYSKFIKQN